MAIVVIGGHSRNVGKTSVVAGLIAALSAYNWTAFKITQFGHGHCSLNRSGKSDSSRFLVAGAKRSFWVRTEHGRLAEALPTITRRLAESENAILESNSILKFIQPDVYISVVDPAVEDFKASALAAFNRADALIVNADHNGSASWNGIAWDAIPDRPIFPMSPPNYVTEGMVGFVRAKLSLPSLLSRLP